MSHYFLFSLRPSGATWLEKIYANKANKYRYILLLPSAGGGFGSNCICSFSLAKRRCENRTNRVRAILMETRS